MLIKDNVILFTNCYFPLSKKLIFLLSPYNRIVLAGKHPALVKEIYKQITDKNLYRSQRENFALYFSVDTRSYFQVKKMFKTIKTNWSHLDYIFHFEIYNIEKELKSIPIHSIKLMFQYNQLSLLNLIKAAKTYLSEHPRVYTLQALKRKSIFYSFKETMINYLKTEIPVGKIYLPFLELMDSSVESQLFSKNQLEYILLQLWKQKEEIFLNRKEYWFYKLFLWRIG